MATADGTLARSLSLVYRYYLESLTDAHTARIFARDWPANTGSLAAAITRVGGPVAWLEREPLGPDDDTPYVIASVDPSTGMVRFDAATARQVEGLPDAERFNWDGTPIGQ